MQLKIPAGKCDRYCVEWKWSTRRLVEDWMSRGLTNTHMARGFSDLYHVFARKQCILCPALHHGCLTLKSMLHRFEIFSAPGTIAHSSIRLLPCSLASSWGCSLAINITWQQHHNRFSSNWISARISIFFGNAFTTDTLGACLLLCEVSQKCVRGISRYLWISTKRVYILHELKTGLAQTNLLLFRCFWKVVITHLFFKI